MLGGEEVYGMSGLSENLGYVYDGDRLLSVRDTVQSRDYSFTYDEAGNVTKDDFTGLTYRHNVIGKVSEIFGILADGNE